MTYPLTPFEQSKAGLEDMELAWSPVLGVLLEKAMPQCGMPVKGKGVPTIAMLKKEARSLGLGTWDMGSIPAKQAAKMLDDVLKEMRTMKQTYPELFRGLKKNPVKGYKFSNTEYLRGRPPGTMGTYFPDIEKIEMGGKSVIKHLAGGQKPTQGGWHAVTGGAETVKHELGHHVYYNLGWRGWSRWDSLYAAHGKNASKFLSKYGATDAREMFAEMFTAYTTPGYSRAFGSVPKQLNAFMKEALKGRMK